MKKRIFMLVTFGVIAIISGILLIPMIGYVISYSIMSSYMTLGEAIVTIIFLCVVILISIAGIVIVALKMKNSKT